MNAIIPDSITATESNHGRFRHVLSQFLILKTRVRCAAHKIVKTLICKSEVVRNCVDYVDYVSAKHLIMLHTFLSNKLSQ